jgi:hypothetical protein
MKITAEDIFLPLLPTTSKTTTITQRKQQQQPRQQGYCHSRSIRSTREPCGHNTQSLHNYCDKAINRFNEITQTVNHDEDDDNDVETISHHWRKRGSPSFSLISSGSVCLDQKDFRTTTCSSENFVHRTDPSPRLVFRTSSRGLEGRVKTFNKQVYIYCHESSGCWLSSTSCSRSQRTQTSTFFYRCS